VTNGSLQSLDLLTLKSLSIDPFISGLLVRVPTTINNPSIGDGLNTGGYSFNQRNNETRDNTSMRLDWNPPRTIPSVGRTHGTGMFRTGRDSDSV